MNKRGFTLSELLIAVVILALVITGLLSTAVTCLLSNKLNNNLVKAANDAQYVLEQIKGLAYSQISSYTAPTFSNLQNETITLTRSVGTNIAEVTVNVNWKEGNCEQPQCYRNYALTTRFAK